jgi:hypothetical protein
MSDIFPETPITSLPAAVAFLGALPVPIGPEPQELPADRLTVLRKLRTHCEADRFESEDERPLHVWGPSQYPKREMCQRCTVTREWAEDADADEVVLVAEIDRLTAQRDRRRTRLIALENDALNMRGALSPNGEARKVPFPLGPTLLPAVEWLIGRVADLEAERHTTNEALDDAVQELRARQSCPCPPADQPGPHQVGCFFDGVPVSPPSERPVNEPTAAVAPVAALREVLDGEHFATVHHDYRVGHDLPEGCRLSEEQVRELGNPFFGGGA